MSRAATDADFNKDNRYLDAKIEIYFDGDAQAPLTVTTDNYLIDVSWIEEGSADSSNPLGVISSNQISFSMYNESGMFSPTNPSGPYYGKIKPNVKVIPYIKPDKGTNNIDWEKLGEYYVTGWDAQITGSYADITANDKWYSIFNSPVPDYSITPDISYAGFLQDIFELLGYDVDVDEALSTILPYAFVDGTFKAFLQSFVEASLAYVTTDKAGTPVVGAYVKDRTIRATLTDDNQIKTVSAKQSIIRSYDGVDLKYNVPQVSELRKLVDLLGQFLAEGDNAFDNIAFSYGPAWQVNDVYVKAPSRNISLKSFRATPDRISLVINSLIAGAPIDLAVYGKIIDLTEVTLIDDAAKLLKFTSKYVQTASYATHYKSILNAFISNTTPVLSLAIRGNPLLNVGDKVAIQSTKYNLNFTGIVQRLQYEFNGALSCTMTLINSEVLQGGD